MKVIVLAGFLGSGKTSVLLKLAKYIVKRDGEEGRTSVAIIENEIGEVGVDDKILARRVSPCASFRRLRLLHRRSGSAQRHQYDKKRDGSQMDHS